MSVPARPVERGVPGRILKLHSPCGCPDNSDGSFVAYLEYQPLSGEGCRPREGREGQGRRLGIEETAYKRLLDGAYSCPLGGGFVGLDRPCSVGGFARFPD